LEVSASRAITTTLVGLLKEISARGG